MKCVFTNNDKRQQRSRAMVINAGFYYCFPYIVHLLHILVTGLFLGLFVLGGDFKIDFSVFCITV